MNYSEIRKNELNKYSKNEIIFASKLYKDTLYNQNVSEMAFYKLLERMHKNHEIEKLGKGIYYFPKNSKFGRVPLSDDDIISMYTGNKKGMVVGYKLFNKLKLTTQISKKKVIYSSKVENDTKKIGNVEIKNVQVKYSKEYIKIIEMLEVLQSFYEIQDINYKEFFNYAKEFANTYNEETTDEVISKIKYKKSTISFLNNILNYFKIENNLDKYLSSLSKYNHASMEEIYELARTQGWF